MNDSLRTNVFVRFQPETIACACIYLAARALQVSAVLPFCRLQLLEVQFQEAVAVRAVDPWSQCSFVPSLQIPLPTRPHWFLLFGTTEEEIQEICLTTLKLYTRKKVPPCCVCVLGSACCLSWLGALGASLCRSSCAAVRALLCGSCCPGRGEIRWQKLRNELPCWAGDCESRVGRNGMETQMAEVWLCASCYLNSPITSCWIKKWKKGKWHYRKLN